MDTLVNPGVQSSYTADGPIAGLIAAQQLQDWMESQGRSFRNNDLQYSSDLNKYQNSMADNPVIAAQRSNALSEATNTQEQWKPGGQMPQLASATREKAISDQLAGKSLNDLKMIDARNSWAVGAGNQLEDASKATTAAEVGMIHARNKDVYENYILPQARKVGADAGLPSTYDPNSVPKILTQRSQAAINTAPFIQKSLEIQLENKGKTDVATISGKYHESASRYNTEATLAAMGLKMPAMEVMEKNILSDAQNKGEVTQSQFEQLVQIRKVRELDKSGKTSFTGTDADRNAISVLSEKDPKRLAMLKEAGLPLTATANEYSIAVEKKRLDDAARESAKTLIGTAKIVPDKVANTPSGGTTTSANTLPRPKGMPTRLVGNPPVLPDGTPDTAKWTDQNKIDNGYVFNKEKNVWERKTPSGVTGEW